MEKIGSIQRMPSSRFRMLACGYVCSSRVPSLTSGLLLSMRETVAVDTCISEEMERRLSFGVYSACQAFSGGVFLGTSGAITGAPVCRARLRIRRLQFVENPCRAASSFTEVRMAWSSVLAGAFFALSAR